MEEQRSTGIEKEKQQRGEAEEDEDRQRVVRYWCRHVDDQLYVPKPVTALISKFASNFMFIDYVECDAAGRCNMHHLKTKSFPPDSTFEDLFKYV